MVSKVIALLEGLSLADLDAAAPVHRRKFSDLCRHWHQLAERRQKQKQPKAGILSKLKDGERSE
jgi:hypothetical protein